MKVYVIILVLFIFLLCYCFYKPDYSQNDNKVSVLILNYKRPHNLEVSLPKLVKYPIIKEILVVNGHPKYSNIPIKSSKITYVDDFENNDIYGGARRFLHNDKLSSNHILILDDDIIPTEYFVNKAYETSDKNDTMVGHRLYARHCDKDGYNHNIFDNNFVLTGCAMIPKTILNEYINHPNGFNLYREWLEKHNGNCEDLTFNTFLIRQLNKHPIAIYNSNITELDNNNGYSSDSSHYEIRDNFCKTYMK